MNPIPKNVLDFILLCFPIYLIILDATTVDLSSAISGKEVEGSNYINHHNDQAGNSLQLITGIVNVQSMQSQGNWRNLKS